MFVSIHVHFIMYIATVILDHYILSINKIQIGDRRNTKFLVYLISVPIVLFI